jgi:hypothetical protein
MVAHMKSTASRPRKVKDWEDGQSYGLNVDLGFFCGVGFSRLVASNEMMPHMPKDHESWWVVDDGNHVMVPNLSEMISINALVTRVSAQVPESTRCWWEIGSSTWWNSTLSVVPTIICVDKHHSQSHWGVNFWWSVKEGA